MISTQRSLQGFSFYDLEMLEGHLHNGCWLCLRLNLFSPHLRCNWSQFFSSNWSVLGKKSHQLLHSGPLHPSRCPWCCPRLGKLQFPFLQGHVAGDSRHSQAAPGHSETLDQPYGVSSELSTMASCRQEILRRCRCSKLC